MCLAAVALSAVASGTPAAPPSADDNQSLNSFAGITRPVTPESRHDKDWFRTIQPVAYAPDRVVVRFMPAADADLRAKIHESVGIEAVQHRFRLVPDLVVVRVAPGRVPAAIDAYLDQPEVMYAEPDYLGTLNNTPNDALFTQLWGLNNTGQTIRTSDAGTPDADIDAVEAWDVWTGDPQYRIGIVDAGIDRTHPDLMANLWTNPGEIPANGLDDDHNGFIDDVHGYDFWSTDNDPQPDAPQSHGTHVAGTVGAHGNNGIDVCGVNWRCRLVSMKIGGSGSAVSGVAAMQSIEYLVDICVRFSNHSWGGGGFSQAMFDTIEAAQSRDHMVIAAAGNGGADQVGDDNDVTPHYPSSYDLPNIISVAALNNDDGRGGFSNFGLVSVDLGAPGVTVLSTVLGANTSYFNGTSMATPHTTGVAALVHSRYPGLSSAQIKARLLDTTRPVASMSGITVTGGALNAAAALEDCNTNGTPDDQDVVIGPDCDTNGNPDVCDADCDTNGLTDACDAITDCDANGVPDACDLCILDCNTNDIVDACETDCDTNGIPDTCSLQDCNTNGVHDPCELAGNDCDTNDVPDECEPGSGDCDTNGTTDRCDPGFVDCDGNDVWDFCDLADADNDCNTDGLLDACQTVVTFTAASAALPAFDANNPAVFAVAGAPAAQEDVWIIMSYACDCALATETFVIDINGIVVFNSIPSTADCAVESNLRLVISAADWNDARALGAGNVTLTASAAIDVSPGVCTNGFMDWSVQYVTDRRDCDDDGVLDRCATAGGLVPDCNTNDMPDACDLVSHVELDSGTIAPFDFLAPAEFAITGAPATAGDVTVYLDYVCDCSAAGAETFAVDLNGIPVFTSTVQAFDCAIAMGAPFIISASDWNDAILIGAGDVTLTATAASAVNSDVCANSRMRYRVVYQTPSADCNGNGIPDDCDAQTADDCNSNGTPDFCEAGAGDCDTNGQPDLCQPGFDDCNGNGVADACDIAYGTSQSCGQADVPVECDILGDCNNNGVSDACDVAGATSTDCNTNGIPDECDAFFVFQASSGIIAPFDDNTPATLILTGLQPATSSVNFTLDYQCDCSSASEVFTVSVNGVPVFVSTPGTADCDDESGVTFMVDAADWNAAVALGAGNATVTAVPSSTVDFNVCGGSFIDITIEFTGGTDGDANGIPDECQGVCLTCAGDVNGDGLVDGDDVSCFVARFLTGSAGPCGTTGCWDFDDNDTLDGTDLTQFVDRLTGAPTACN